MNGSTGNPTDTGSVTWINDAMIQVLKILKHLTFLFLIMFGEQASRAGQVSSGQQLEKYEQSEHGHAYTCARAAGGAFTGITETNTNTAPSFFQRPSVLYCLFSTTTQIKHLNPTLPVANGGA